MTIVFTLVDWSHLLRMKNPESVSDNPENFDRCVARERGMELDIANQLGLKVVFALPKKGSYIRTMGISEVISGFDLFDSENNPCKTLNGPVFVRGHCGDSNRVNEAVIALGGVPWVSKEDGQKATEWLNWIKPEFLKRRMVKMPMQDVLDKKTQDLANNDGQIFIKTEKKHLHGICSWNCPLEVIGYDCEILSPNETFIVSEVISILNDDLGDLEWRIWMTRNGPVTFSRKLDYVSDYETDPAIEQFAVDFAKAHPQAPVAYVLDVAHTSNGIAVIELNDIRASGRYENNNFETFIANIL